MTTLLSYDAVDRVLTNIVAGISTNSFIYSTNGLVQSLDGLRQNITGFQNDVLGRILVRTNANTEVTQFKYDPSGNITNFVDGKLQKTILQYDTFNRLTNKLDTTLTSVLKLTYDADSRIATRWTPEKGTTTYIRDPMGRIRTNSYNTGIGGSYSSPLVQTISLPNGMSITNGYDNDGRQTATIMLNSSSAIVDAEQYGYNADNWRTNETRFDGSSIAYGYDHIGQLKAANAKESGGTSRLNEQFGYAYDSANNLNARTNNTLTETFGVNSINELTSATTAGTLTAAGNTAQSATSVSVNSQSAATYGDNTFATTAGLNLANGANTFTTVVQYASATLTNITTSQLPTPVAFLYDANGNLTNDGLRSFSYDDENHLVEAAIPGLAKSDFFYDGLGRRRIVQSYVWTGTWTLTNEVHYIYDGKLVVQERDANNNVLATYDRGLDLSGGLQGASGVGGLLARTDIKGTLFYHSDGVGNVTTLFDKYQTLEARYLYDPYGNIVGKWGAYADVNLYRYSSKEYNPIGIYDFGGRFYDPNIQRFLNRDPLGEVGGVNLYGYVANNPVNLIDPYGLSWFSDFGDWELNTANKAKELFTGNPCDYHLDPNSLQYLSNQAGVGVTPLTDQNGNQVDAADLALDVFAQPLIALTTGGLGDLADLAAVGGAGELGNAGRLATEAGGGESAIAAERLAQDIAVSRDAPEALSTARPIGQSATQNAAAQEDVAALESQGYTDIRVNQQQVNAAGEGNAVGERVGVNRPDIQATSPTGQRVYIEYDTSASSRAAGHLQRILANDPNGMVVLKTVN